jgi:hypothetical protein
MSSQNTKRMGIHISTYLHLCGQVELVHREQHQVLIFVLDEFET